MKVFNFWRLRNKAKVQCAAACEFGLLKLCANLRKLTGQKLIALTRARVHVHDTQTNATGILIFETLVFSA